MMPEVTNRQRADWARTAQDAFDPQVYFPNLIGGQSIDDVEPLAVRIKDLITDLLHLARLDAGVPIEDLEVFVQSARSMHDMEAAEDLDYDDDEVEDRDGEA